MFITIQSKLNDITQFLYDKNIHVKYKLYFLSQIIREKNITYNRYNRKKYIKIYLIIEEYLENNFSLNNIKYYPNDYFLIKNLNNNNTIIEIIELMSTFPIINIALFYYKLYSFLYSNFKNCKYYKNKRDYYSNQTVNINNTNLKYLVHNMFLLNQKEDIYVYLHLLINKVPNVFNNFHLFIDYYSKYI